MANSMDGILVTYGASLTEKERHLIDHPADDTEREQAKELKSKIKTLTVPAFLAVPAKELSSVEQKIQAALKVVYDLNGKNPPLYEKFPDFRPNKPLTIDITTTEKSSADYVSSYDVNDNIIDFVETKVPEYLINSLAHELKHAEQFDADLIDLNEKLIYTNGYAFHQLRFLIEAQAMATAARACHEWDPDKPFCLAESRMYRKIFEKCSSQNGVPPCKEAEEKLTEDLLDWVYTDPYYKDYFDYISPLRDDDKGLSQIPKSLHLSANLLKKLAEAPKEASSWNNKLRHACFQRNWNRLGKLCQKALKQKEKINGLYVTETLQAAPIQHVNRLLNMKSQGKYLVQDKDIINAFEVMTNPRLHQMILDESVTLDPKRIAYFITAQRDGKWLISEEQLKPYLQSSNLSPIVQAAIEARQGGDKPLKKRLAKNARKKPGPKDNPNVY